MDNSNTKECLNLRDQNYQDKKDHSGFSAVSGSNDSKVEFASKGDKREENTYDRILEWKGPAPRVLPSDLISREVCAHIRLNDASSLYKHFSQRSRADSYDHVAAFQNIQFYKKCAKNDIFCPILSQIDSAYIMDEERGMRFIVVCSNFYKNKTKKGGICILTLYVGNDHTLLDRPEDEFSDGFDSDSSSSSSDLGYAGENIPYSNSASQQDLGVLYFNNGYSHPSISSNNKNPSKIKSRLNISFSDFPTCCNINKIKSIPPNINILIGFKTGIIMNYVNHDPTECRFFNQKGSISKRSVTKVEWVPESKEAFLATFFDEFLYLFHINYRDDLVFSSRFHPKTRKNVDLKTDDMYFNMDPNNAIWSRSLNTEQFTSISELNAEYPPQTYMNPVLVWSICPGWAITDFAFSHSNERIAVTSNDGFLRIYEYKSKQLLNVFKSYYGGFTCVAWSPGDFFLATGGEDDLVSLWSHTEKKLIARGEAHASWISKIRFDPYRYKDGVYYRFASISHDCHIAMWDFAEKKLSRPFLVKPPLSTPDLTQSRCEEGPSDLSDFSSSTISSNIIDPLKRPKIWKTTPVSSKVVCVLHPLSITKVSRSPCSDFRFLGKNLLLIVDRIGHQYCFVLSSQ